MVFPSEGKRIKTIYANISFQESFKVIDIGNRSVARSFGLMRQLSKKEKFDALIASKNLVFNQKNPYFAD